MLRVVSFQEHISSKNPLLNRASDCHVCRMRHKLQLELLSSRSPMTKAEACFFFNLATSMHEE